MTVRPERPIITAEVTFLHTAEGGRVQPPVFDMAAPYMPHLVVQPRDVRTAVVDPEHGCREPYQGVAFIDGPGAVSLGGTAEFKLELIYHPRNRYEDLRPGATFTVREGAKVVAHGIVLDRRDTAT